MQDSRSQVSLVTGVDIPARQALNPLRCRMPEVGPVVRLPVQRPTHRLRHWKLAPCARGGSSPVAGAECRAQFGPISQFKPHSSFFPVWPHLHGNAYGLALHFALHSRGFFKFGDSVGAKWVSLVFPREWVGGEPLLPPPVLKQPHLPHSSLIIILTTHHHPKPNAPPNPMADRQRLSTQRPSSMRPRAGEGRGEGGAAARRDGLRRGLPSGGPGSGGGGGGARRVGGQPAVGHAGHHGAGADLRPEVCSAVCVVETAIQGPQQDFQAAGLRCVQRF